MSHLEPHLPFLSLHLPLEPHHPIQKQHQFSPALREVHLVLCALKTAATCSRLFAQVVLKIPFSAS